MTNKNDIMVVGVKSKSFPEQPKEYRDDRITKLSWKGNDGWLVHGVGSNFFIEPDGTNVEGEFQAMKHENPFTRRVLVKKWARVNPGTTKKLGRKLPLRADWEDVKRDVMTDLVRKKFYGNPDLALWLMATGDKEIVEGNTWHDNEWGVCHCQKCVNVEGKNWLGQILVQIRNELLEWWDMDADTGVLR